MNLSPNTKEAIKTALAMTIAYGVGLQMGWDRPYWAGFAVAFISLATVGQSLNKGILRLVGTVMGAVMALLIIALFAQQRWLFIFFLSLWCALCTYMMAGPRHSYFWFVAGFVSLIICADGMSDASKPFTIAMLRLQQTGLGVMVYSLITILLWPHNSRKDLQATASKHAATQQKLFKASLQLFQGTGDTVAVKTLRSDQMSEHTQLAVLMDAAVSDSDEVRELEKLWRDYQWTTGELGETMQRWRESFNEVQSLPVQQLLPGLEAFSLEIDCRLSGIASMMSEEAAPSPRAKVELTFDRFALQQLSHFHRAALLLTRQHMLRIEELSRNLFDTVGAIYGFAAPPEHNAQPATHRAPWVPDPDRLLAAGQIMLILWLGFLAVIYIGDFPGGFGFLAMCGPIGMMLVTNPQLPMRLLYAPAAVGIAFASILYIFVMPQLSSFAGLGLMIFSATFIICYRYATPQQGLGRAFGLAMFVVIISVSNQQTYSFLSVANTALMFSLMFLLLGIVAYIPFSPLPDRALLRLLTRYFRSAEYLVSQPAPRGKTAPDSRRAVFHTQELTSLPAKLTGWAVHADPITLGAASVQQLPLLVNSLQALTYRLLELQEVRNLPQSPLLVTALDEEMQAWRQRVIEGLQQLSTNPSYRESLMRARLDDRLQRLEDITRACFDSSAGDNLTPEEEENCYRMLGAYRGISESLLDFAERAGGLDWAPWYEERFA